MLIRIRPTSVTPLGPEYPQGRKINTNQRNSDKSILTLNIKRVSCLLKCELKIALIRSFAKGDRNTRIKDEFSKLNFEMVESMLSLPISSFRVNLHIDGTSGVNIMAYMSIQSYERHELSA